MKIETSMTPKQMKALNKLRAAVIAKNDRNLAIVQAKHAGLSLSQIAAEVKLTKQGVSWILKRLSQPKKLSPPFQN